MKKFLLLIGLCALASSAEAAKCSGKGDNSDCILWVSMPQGTKWGMPFCSDYSYDETSTGCCSRPSKPSGSATSKNEADYQCPGSWQIQ